MRSASARPQAEGRRPFPASGHASPQHHGALVDSPPLIELAREDRIESYTLPQGFIAQMMREMAAGRPGLITKTGLHTFVDPRQRGARQSASAKEDLVELLTVDGQEWLRFKPFPLDVVLLRGTPRTRMANQHGAGGDPGRDALLGAGRAAAGCRRHRAGQAVRAARDPAAAQRQDFRHPRRLRRGRSGPAADLLDRLRSELFG